MREDNDEVGEYSTDMEWGDTALPRMAPEGKANGLGPAMEQRVVEKGDGNYKKWRNGEWRLAQTIIENEGPNIPQRAYAETEWAEEGYCHKKNDARGPNIGCQ